MLGKNLKTMEKLILNNEEIKERIVDAILDAQLNLMYNDEEQEAVISMGGNRSLYVTYQISWEGETVNEYDRGVWGCAPYASYYKHEDCHVDIKRIIMQEWDEEIDDVGDEWIVEIPELWKIEDKLRKEINYEYEGIL